MQKNDNLAFSFLLALLTMPAHELKSSVHALHVAPTCLADGKASLDPLRSVRSVQFSSMLEKVMGLADAQNASRKAPHLMAPRPRRLFLRRRLGRLVRWQRPFVSGSCLRHE